jgi:hypothetical protein
VGTSKLPATTTITANIEQPLTVLRYAVTANVTAAPVFSDADAAYQNVTVDNGSVVAIEATGSDGVTQFFYKVTIAAIPDTLTGANVGGVPATLGTPGGANGAVTLTPTQAGASVTVAATGVPAGSTVRYGLASWGVDFKGNAELQAPTDWNTDGVFAGGMTAGTPIYVELTPTGLDDTTTYKIDVIVQ